jgi:hypothetical protein
MKTQATRLVVATALGCMSLFAQQAVSRQATPMRGGSPDRGKCTIEVVVDDVAQVEIMGNNATLRTLAGQPSQWRRFECSAPLPPNPAGFRFAGVDGRGRQTLTREPRNGPAVIQIEDKQGGSEGYTFDIFWEQGGGGGQYSNAPNAPYPNAPNPRAPYQAGPGQRGGGDDRDRYRGDTYRDGYRDSEYYRRYGHGYSVDEAVRVCQNAAADEAGRRFRTTDIHFHRTSADDRPGRRDWVTGTLDVHRGPREESYGFSCSMDFNAGRLRSVQLDDRPQYDRR